MNELLDNPAEPVCIAAGLSPENKKNVVKKYHRSGIGSLLNLFRFDKIVIMGMDNIRFIENRSTGKFETYIAFQPLQLACKLFTYNNINK